MNHRGGPLLVQVERERWLFSIDARKDLGVLRPLYFLLANQPVYIKGSHLSPVLSRELRRVNAIPIFRPDQRASYIVSCLANKMFDLRTLKDGLLPLNSKKTAIENNRLSVVDIYQEELPVWKDFTDNEKPCLYVDCRYTKTSPFVHPRYDTDSSDEEFDECNHPYGIRVDPNDGDYCQLCNMRYQSAKEHRQSPIHSKIARDDSYWVMIDQLLS